jgi:6-phosphofructokinase 1
MRIAISTGGGDAPGINSVIRAAALSAVRRGWEVVGIRDGFNGLMLPDHYPDNAGVVTLTRESVRGIAHLGGTILGSTNRGSPTDYPVQRIDGTWTSVDRSEELVGLFRDAGIDALITIGGDGTIAIARKLFDAGLRDRCAQDDRQRPRHDRHDLRVRHGRGCDGKHRATVHHGHLAQPGLRRRSHGSLRRMDRSQCGYGRRCPRDLDPEIPFDLKFVAMIAKRGEAARFAIVVVAEGANPGR